MTRVVTFGEIMLRLSPPDHLRFSQAHNFDAIYGGGESNVAVSLAHFGIETSFVTRLPANDIGDACQNTLRQYFGLGDATTVDEMTVRWPRSGATQTFRNVAANRIVEITEGTSELVEKRYAQRNESRAR